MSTAGMIPIELYIGGFDETLHRKQKADGNKIDKATHLLLVCSTFRGFIATTNDSSGDGLRIEHLRGHSAPEKTII